MEENEIYKIGPYEFSRQSYTEASLELKQGFKKGVDYLLFDEIGNLELKKKQGKTTSWNSTSFWSLRKNKIAPLIHPHVGPKKEYWPFSNFHPDVFSPSPVSHPMPHFFHFALMILQKKSKLMKHVWGGGEYGGKEILQKQYKIDKNSKKMKIN